MKNYNKYISSLSKKELVELIVGTNEKPPLLLPDEPKFSRPQLIWAMLKLKGWNLNSVELEVNYIINKIQGHKWDLLYNYNYLRFDVKKPSLYVVLILLIFSLFGIIMMFWLIYNLIFEWI